MPDKILMLDIDGVLSPFDAKLRSGDAHVLTADAVALLNDIVTRTGAAVVVSSTWRRDDRCRKTLIAAGFQGRFAADWRTAPFIDKERLVDADAERGSEIADWLVRNGPHTIAIVDDDCDMLPEQVGQHVRTDTARGLTRADADALIAILNDNRKP